MQLTDLLSDGVPASDATEASEAMPVAEISAQLEASEKLMKELTTSWEDKVKQAEAVKQERQKVGYVASHAIVAVMDCWPRS